MKSIKAIFVKEVKNLLKTPAVLCQFAVFPLLAFVLTELVAKRDELMPDGTFIAMFLSMFVGMTITTTIATVIAEDREKKSLRFLVMAGVKPMEYLLGIGGAFIAAGLFVCAAFAVMNGLAGLVLVRFMGMLVLGLFSSVLLGALIGIFSKNQLTATTVGTPVGMVLGMGPMVATFDETAQRLFSVFYTQQISILTNNPLADFSRPVLVILSNIVVLAVLFTLAYGRKGLRS